MFSNKLRTASTRCFYLRRRECEKERSKDLSDSFARLLTSKRFSRCIYRRCKTFGKMLEKKAPIARAVGVLFAQKADLIRR